MFSVAGVSTQNGVTKVRFANDLVSRYKLLSKGGHDPLELVELPRAMTKAEACQYLLDAGGVFTQWSSLIVDTMGKKTGSGAHLKAATPVTKTAKKVSAKKVHAAVNKVKPAPKADDDLEIKELAALL
jgi:hypothetical protein